MNKKKVSAETLVRTVVLVVALLNQVLTMFGKNPLPFAGEELYSMLTALVTVVATIWAWWKNNSFTSAAIQADVYLARLKGKEN